MSGSRWRPFESCKGSFGTSEAADSPPHKGSEGSFFQISFPVSFLPTVLCVVNPFIQQAFFVCTPVVCPMLWFNQVSRGDEISHFTISFQLSTSPCEIFEWNEDKSPHKGHFCRFGDSNIFNSVSKIEGHFLFFRSGHLPLFTHRVFLDFSADLQTTGDFGVFRLVRMYVCVFDAPSFLMSDFMKVVILKEFSVEVMSHVVKELG